MNELDQRIKIISNRCENELKPRFKAVSFYLLLIKCIVDF